MNQVSGLQLDQATALLSSETPSQSTEPQPEPWSAPTAGYKWYDTSTFASGSDAVTKGGTNSPQLLVLVRVATLQAILPTEATYSKCVKVSGLSANTTYSTFNLGAYNGSGTQIAKVQNADGSWPSSVWTTAAIFQLQRTQLEMEERFQCQLNRSAAGSANPRLRQSGTNAYTEA